jgi:hypothetical protein
MQIFPFPVKPAVGIIFDSDLGIDDVLALALMYGFETRREARVVGLSTTRSSVKAAAFHEAVARFYFSRPVPVGMADDGQMPEDAPMLTAPLGRMTAEGKPAYTHTVETVNDTADPATSIRNAFTAQHNQNALAVLAGPATNLSRALGLPGVRDLVAEKARMLSIVGDSSFKRDVKAARVLLAEWPAPVVVCGPDVGSELSFPASSIEKDFAWATTHPILDAYRAHQPAPYDAPAWAMAAVLHAVKPDDGFFKLSEPGTFSVRDDGSLELTPSAAGKHRRLIFDPAQKDRILKTFTEVASVKPVRRFPRRRPG